MGDVYFRPDQEKNGSRWFCRTPRNRSSWAQRRPITARHLLGKKRPSRASSQSSTPPDHVARAHIDHRIKLRPCSRCGESPSRDLADLVARDRNVTLISHYMPAMAILRFNQLYPPFDKPEARRALLSVVDQTEAMTAIAGADPANWLDGIGLFSHGTPLANDAGIDILRRPRDSSAAKRQLAEAGYGGEPIVVIAPTDVMHALSLVGADQLRRAGLKVDLQEMEFGAVVKRRTSQSPPDKGGWNVFFTLIDRSIPNIHPFGNPALRADGKAAYDGWPDSPRIEELRRAWLDAAILPSSVALRRNCRCWCGRTYHSSRWASTGRLRPTARASPGSSRVASPSSTTSSVHRGSFWHCGQSSPMRSDVLGCAGRGCWCRVALSR
jgi:hypothetical protein